ncbi:diaminopimelate decarboxylase [Pseudorhodoplanes sinuspersici]|uniref:Diaminopimelate decarboxylase n=1 Tax=Pseudorhodoplanes sinuspersici TaxID=1235591 RepID=A0A1W6ZQR8_9HYPH|nr:diaminopimelate decarboxylase [Pseudorhodoplanes sinuspersici]ARP99709.1 diaminopimelate decarboxylase [Pseudorhodoplanes sinuspersici]RKE70691.1 diaminopimelate decarboxylase [Pseudorhodoplanes sinuspersici]
MLATDKHAGKDLAGQLVNEYFSVKDNDLVVGGRTVRSLAEEFGTPLYIYDAAIMRRCFAQLKAALAGFAEIYFSIKANPNPAVAALFVQQGAGIEIASAGEYERARRAGAKPQNILFAGPGKRDDELEHVIRGGIGEIHLESFEEIDRVEAIAARHGKTVAVAIRINPVASAQGGAMRMGGKPSPFGFDEEQIGDVLAALAGKTHLDLAGLHLFAGTQILEAETLLTQWKHGLDLSARIARDSGRTLRSIDLGGGLGIPYYAGDRTLDLDALRKGLPPLIAMKAADPLLQGARVIVEPGRYLAGPGGLYVARVVASKMSRGSRFIVTDGGMHHHLAASGNLGQVMKRDYPIVAPARMTEPRAETCSIVGPLCTPLDTLARKVDMPKLQAGDLIAILQSGAYGLSASPVDFLGHPAPAEVLVDDGKASVIRERENFAPAD